MLSTAWQRRPLRLQALHVMRGLDCHSQSHRWACLDIIVAVEVTLEGMGARVALARVRRAVS